jgi:prefoldin subunit 5
LTIGCSICNAWEHLTAMAGRSTENEVLAQQLDHIGNAIEALEARIGEVEAVIPRLETAAQMTARALDEVSSHWDAVYRAMRRAE